jgi:DNA primase
MTGIPTWAGLSTAGMINLSLPLELKTLVICIDHDEAGIKASHALQKRAMSQGIAVKRLMPPNVGTDFNDFIKEMF